MSLSRMTMTAQAKQLRKTMEEKGLIKNEPQTTMAILCCKQYLDWGIDHVLVGMKNKLYVDQLKDLF